MLSAQMARAMAVAIARGPVETDAATLCTLFEHNLPRQVCALLQLFFTVAAAPNSTAAQIQRAIDAAAQAYLIRCSASPAWLYNSLLYAALGSSTNVTPFVKPCLPDWLWTSLVTDLQPGLVTLGVSLPIQDVKLALDAGHPQRTRDFLNIVLRVSRNDNYVFATEVAAAIDAEGA